MRNWNLLRKFWNLHIYISMENWLFIHFLSLLPGPLSFYTALENNTIYLQHFFRFQGEGTLPPWFFGICFNKFNKPCVNFLRVWTKNANRGKFCENFEKPSSENCEKCIILAFFKRILTNHAFIFSRLDEKHKLLGNFEKIF